MYGTRVHVYPVLSTHTTVVQVHDMISDFQVEGWHTHRVTSTALKLPTEHTKLQALTAEYSLL